MTEHSEGTPVHIPKIGFRWDFSLGNVLSMVVMTTGAIAAWYSLSSKTDNAIEAVAHIPVIEQRVTSVETSLALINQTIDIGRTARLTFQASVVETFQTIEADRREQSDVNAEVLAQLRVVISRLDDMNRASMSSELRAPHINNYEAALARAITTR